MELQLAFQTERSEAAYFAAITGKTAALFGTSCRIGALCGDLPHDQVDRLTEVGETLGVLYQIIDDLNDLTMTEAELGKPTGHDLVEGIYTLPVIRALAMDDVGRELRPILTPAMGRPEADKAIAIVRSSGALESTWATAASWAERASRIVEELPEGPGRTALGRMSGLFLPQR